MLRSLVLTLIFMFLMGCDQSTKELNVQLQKQVDSLNAIVVKLQQTDNFYYQMGVDNNQKGQYEESSTYLNQLIARFPESKLVSKAQKLITANTVKIEEKREAALKQGCDLELLSWSWGTSYGYATVKGQIKNISSKRLENVEAVASFYDKNHNFITSGSALIEYNPILPGQTSPFEAMETANPEMYSATVEFKFLSGGSISTYKKRK